MRGSEKIFAVENAKYRLKKQLIDRNAVKKVFWIT